MKKLFKLCINTSEWSPTRSDWLRLVLSLPKSERDRIVAFAHKRDSKNSLVGQILLRLCLKRLIPKAQWPSLIIERNSKGRPCLRLKETLQISNILDFGTNQIDFNVTHSGDLCAVVAGIRPISIPVGKNTDTWLGIDCMKIEVDNRPQTSNPIDPYEKEFGKKIIGFNFR